MKRDGAVPESAKQYSHPLGFVDGAGEDDHGFGSEFVDEPGHVDVFVFVGDEAVALEEGGDGLVFVCTDGDAEGVGKGSSLEALDFRGHCRREEIGTAFSWEDFEDLGNDGAKVCWDFWSQDFMS